MKICTPVPMTCQTAAHAEKKSDLASCPKVSHALAARTLGFGVAKDARASKKNIGAVHAATKAASLEP